MGDLPELKCDVCSEPAIGVACSGTGPCSYAYCAECASSRREPYGAIVAMAACCGGATREHMAEWVWPMINATLEFFKKTPEQFAADVTEAIVEYDAAHPMESQ